MNEYLIKLGEILDAAITVAIAAQAMVILRKQGKTLEEIQALAKKFEEKNN